MMNFSRKDKVKIIIALFLLFAAVACSVFAIRNWEDSVASGYAVMAALICAVAGWFLIRKYPFNQVTKVFGEFAGFLFAMAGRVINAVKNALGMSNDRYMRTLHIKNYNDEVESIGDTGRRHRYTRPKLKKWKDMNESEKVRYIYAKRNLKHIKKGYNYNDANTPNETMAEMIRKNIEKSEIGELYGVYNPARYKKNFSMEEEKINNLKHKFL